jgi:hypothetical protein
MSDVETQLRDYFDATVERVTAEDILAGRRVFETIRPVTLRRTRHPAWVAVGAFVATAVVLGGTIGLGAVLTGPTGDVGSGGIASVVREATEAASWGWLLIAAIALGIAVAGALIALRRRQGTHEEEEDTMATTIEAPPAETTGTADHNNRGLIVTIVVLAIALLALGAWAIYQQTAESETAAPAAVEELLNDYGAAWNNYDGEAFLALTTADYVHDNGRVTYDQARTANLISIDLKAMNWQLEQVGDRIVSGDGPYYTAEVNQLTSGSTQANDGISTIVVVDTDDGLKVSSHVWTGN